MPFLSGMKEITDYLKKSESTVLSLIRDYSFPAKKLQGIWESDTELIDEWRRKMINGDQHLGNPQTVSRPMSPMSTREASEKLGVKTNKIPAMIAAGDLVADKSPRGHWQIDPASPAFVQKTCQA